MEEPREQSSIEPLLRCRWQVGDGAEIGERVVHLMFINMGDNVVAGSLKLVPVTQMEGTLEIILF